MTTSDGWQWLDSTEKLQIEAYGNDLRSMVGDDRDKHILYNHTAAVIELGEMLNEAPSWKPWSTEIGVLNHQQFRGEIVDVLHFIANLCLLADINEDELWDAYKAKQKRNRKRQERDGGYQASKNACPKCHRELDIMGAYTMVSQEMLPDSTMLFTITCNVCNHRFTYAAAPGESLP